MGVITTHVISHRFSELGQKRPGASMTDFAIRDCLADKASRPVDFGKESVSLWTALARFTPDTH